MGVWYANRSRGLARGEVSEVNIFYITIKVQVEAESLDEAESLAYEIVAEVKTLPVSVEIPVEDAVWEKISLSDEVRYPK